jgi:5-methyltetrahydrofolate--homocysteine methyltransferase
MNQDILGDLSQSIIRGDPDNALSLTEKALTSGLPPLDIINQGLIPGMNVVGNKFSTGEYFLPDLIISAEVMQKAMQLLEPELLSRGEEVASPGVVVLGTVKGDIHEIGKSLVATMLTANGYKVFDLGVDVSASQFIDKIKETQADILGLSALLTTTMVVQRQIIRALEEAGIRDHIKVIVGGAPVTRSWADEIGADGFAEDAISAVALTRRLVGAKA